MTVLIQCGCVVVIWADLRPGADRWAEGLLRVSGLANWRGQQVRSRMAPASLHNLPSSNALVD